MESIITDFNEYCQRVVDRNKLYLEIITDANGNVDQSRLHEQSLKLQRLLKEEIERLCEDRTDKEAVKDILARIAVETLKLSVKAVHLT